MRRRSSSFVICSVTFLLGCAPSSPRPTSSSQPALSIGQATPAPLSTTPSLGGGAVGNETQPPTWPVPPEQNAMWQPKAGGGGLEEGVVDAARTLFKQGLGDPRGCEYRGIEIVVAGVWGDAGDTKTRGWVLPNTNSNGTTTYAVLWDGSISRVKAVYGKVDLRADVDQALADLKTSQTRSSSRTAPPEVTFTLLSALLLSRLGENDLAAKVWTAQKDAIRADNRGAEAYYHLADTWLWTLYDRAINMHMHGEDATALESVRLLHVNLPRVEAELERRGRKRETSYEKGHEKDVIPFINFLKPLPDLERDQERRAAQSPGASRPSGDAGVDPSLSIEKKVATLIGRLDQVAARQWGQPGGVDLGSDPIVQEIVKLGAPAVPALLDTIENDLRLTRSVHFWRDFSHHRQVLGVHEAAYAAFAQIVETSFFHPAATGDDLSARGPEGRKALVKELRAYWDKWKNSTKEDKWFSLLQDDKAKPDDWVRSAGLLAQDLNTSGGPSPRSAGDSRTRQYTGVAKYGPRPSRGDSLRAKTNPSVSDLIERRIETLGSGPPENRGHACQLALFFSEWDAPRAKASLAKEVHRARQPNSDPDGGQTSARCIASLTLERVYAAPKDPNGLKDYAAFMANELTPAALSFLSNQFVPMADFPTDPDIVKAGEKIFGAAGSPWVPFVATEKNSPSVGHISRHSLEDLLNEENAGLLKVPAFKAHVLSALANKKKIGDGVYNDGSTNTKFIDGSQSSEGASPVVRPPPNGTKITVRVNDVYARRLMRHPHTPPFQPYWSEPDRDAAITAMIAWVRAQ